MVTQITINEVKAVKEAFKAFGSVISEARMKITQEGIMLLAMDESHIVLVCLTIKASDMTDFKYDKNLELGLNIDDLNKMLNRINNDSDLTFKYDEKNPKKMIIESKDESIKKVKKYIIGLIDIETEEINIESLEAMEFSNNVKMNFAYLTEALKDSEILSEVLGIESNEDLIRFHAEGTVGEYELIIEKDEMIESNLTEETEGSFAIQFLKNMVKSENIQGISKNKKNGPKSSFDLSLKSDTPLKMNVDFLGNSYMKYFLAPRVLESNDDPYDDDIEITPSKKVEIPSKPLIDMEKAKIQMKKAIEIDQLMAEIEHYAEQKEELTQRVRTIDMTQDPDLGMEILGKIKEVTKYAEARNNELITLEAQFL